MDDVECGGNEEQLTSCDYRNSYNYYCRKKAGVTCNGMFVSASSFYCVLNYIATSHRECNDTDIRLVNGLTLHEGRVEICNYGLWGSICYYQWDHRDARVVCRQLGYDGRESVVLCITKHHYPTPQHRLVCDAIIHQEYQYFIFWMMLIAVEMKKF